MIRASVAIAALVLSAPALSQAKDPGFAHAGVWGAKESVKVLAEEFRISDNSSGLSTPGTKDFAEVR